jgi:hypothetical protein
MNEALKKRDQGAALADTSAQPEGVRRLDWRKKMSDNVAMALIAYTGLHIFATVGAIKSTGLKSLALFALIILVAGIIPACRWFEKRWTGLSDDEAASAEWAADFRRDQIGLWVLAIGLPFLLTSVFTAAA